MHRTGRTFCLLGFLFLCGAIPCPAQAEDVSSTIAWRSAEPGWKYEFPRDHGPHRAFKTEWWYATGTLADSQGDDFGFQLTFFREGIRPGEKSPDASRFRVVELPFAHFALTDSSGRTFRYFQRSSRAAFGEAGFGIPPGRIAWMNDWVLEQLPSGSLHLKASEGGRTVDLTLEVVRPPLVHGHDGISPKSNAKGHASHYYSLTRLKASGTVVIDGKSHAVNGLVWFDHEWATNQLEPEQAGWDWSGLHLSSGDDLMLFRIRDQEGHAVFTSATLRDGTGKVSEPTGFEMKPVGSWKSPHTGGVYPAAWEITLPSISLNLSLRPVLADQELVLSPFAYWEGMVKGHGSLNGNECHAEGYLEMTGYGGKILGLSQ
jgi:predicted secreted hydrolase